MAAKAQPGQFVMVMVDEKGERIPLTIADVIADEVMDAAYEWLCKRRKDFPPNADIWWFRHRWPQEKTQIKTDLLAGRFRFDLLSRFIREDGEELDFSSRTVIGIGGVVDIALNENVTLRFEPMYSQWGATLDDQVGGEECAGRIDKLIGRPAVHRYARADQRQPDRLFYASERRQRERSVANGECLAVAVGQANQAVKAQLLEFGTQCLQDLVGGEQSIDARGRFF